ncbi:MAG: energy transducer TonB, partial [Thiohalorhabdus sp.]|uniref:energy transducer TonB n=1 Tax=Thiohalorhabdus sp. TaxID=3094134 RepID=UPI00397F5DC5
EPEKEEDILSGDLSERIEEASSQSDEPTSIRHRRARDQFVGVVQSAVQEHWLVPPALADREDLQATVRVSLTPDGELAAPPKVVASNGPGHFNSSVVRAVEKAAPFSMPDGPTRYFQEFELNFSPDMAQ